MSEFPIQIFSFESVEFVVFLFATTLAAPILAVTLSRHLRNGVKISLRIAVIGLPRSGKTTLITVVFDAIMSGKIAKYASVQGLETTDRLAEYLSAMVKGIGLAPTTDDEVFAYRYLVERKFAGILPVKHDIEIADFPGEYSEDLSIEKDKKSNVGLFRKEFFSWIVRADKYVFVIDSSKYLAASRTDSKQKDSNFVLETEVSIKNAVLQLKQQLLDENIYDRPVLVVFSKCDIFLQENNILEKIDVDTWDLAYMDQRYDTLLNNEKVVKSALEKMDKMEDDFDRLLVFLANNFKSVEEVRHSSYCNSGIFEGANAKIVSFTSPR